MKLVLAILVGGLVAGALDIIYAIVVWGLRGVPAISILHSVASGLIGREAAYSGGTQTAALGLALHMAIALAMAAAFVVFSRLAPILLRWPFITAIIYGLILFCVMNFIVVPLSAIHKTTVPHGWMLVGALFTHTIFVGVPIVYSARYFLRD